MRECLVCGRPCEEEKLVVGTDLCELCFQDEEQYLERLRSRE